MWNCQHNNYYVFSNLCCHECFFSRSVNLTFSEVENRIMVIMAKKDSIILMIEFILLFILAHWQTHCPRRLLQELQNKTRLDLCKREWLCLQYVQNIQFCVCTQWKIYSISHLLYFVPLPFLWLMYLYRLFVSHAGVRNWRVTEIQGMETLKLEWTFVRHFIHTEFPALTLLVVASLHVNRLPFTRVYNSHNAFCINTKSFSDEISCTQG